MGAPASRKRIAPLSTPTLGRMDGSVKWLHFTCVSHHQTRGMAYTGEVIEGWGRTAHQNAGKRGVRFGLSILRCVLCFLSCRQSQTDSSDSDSCKDIPFYVDQGLLLRPDHFERLWSDLPLLKYSSPYRSLYRGLGRRLASDICGRRKPEMQS
jgi:hypothetical protein